MNEELDSQLSAMFDNELPTAECELLARRLSRDEQLQARWGRYAIVGAVIRAERGVRLNAQVARRVSVVLRSEPALAGPAATGVTRVRNGMRWWQPLAGAAVAAGVAAVSILWLRTEAPSGTPSTVRLTPAVLQGGAQMHVRNGGAQSDSYVVPRPPTQPRPALVPSTELANYVVAHSMFSTPVARRNLLSAFMTSEPAASGTEEPQNNAQSTAQ
ncbi:MAG TPA: sigma-E factor negative regulatory protein [Steroidobacteraceae bacterium]|nr:sigma-E factor negative regulatory protein [Steroidobacteraceae bacterium]